METTVARIYAQYERSADDGLRPHLGASVIGHPCTRHLWLHFRWAEKRQHKGRMLRLFETGQREELRVIENLRAIGCNVSYQTPMGSQHRVSACNDHFGGSLDGIMQGLAEAPETWHVLECKTSNTKDFKQLQDRGVLAVKPMHYAQMQIYMGLRHMDRAAYVVVCKETDEIYLERVHFDRAEFDRLMKRAESVVFASEPPERISNDATWWQCKMCDYHAQCHGTAAPIVNCRTCAHSSPGDNATWQCARTRQEISLVPKQGCADHRHIPILLRNFAEMVDANEEGNWVEYKNTITGKAFWNGDLSSQEITNCADKRVLGDEGMNHWRYEIGAEIVA